MEISWAGNLRQKVRQAWLGGKTVHSIWLGRKQLYPDGNTSSILALRPMNASTDYNYGVWAWILDVMKNKSHDYYEFVVKNDTEFNGGQDFVVVKTKEWDEFWAEENGWSGCFDPETFMLDCKTTEMRLWAMQKKVGDGVKVAMKSTQLYQKYWDLQQLLYKNPRQMQLNIDLPYIYSAENMEGTGFDGISKGLNYRFARKQGELVFSYKVRVMGMPSGKTHIYGGLTVMMQRRSLLFSGSMWQKTNNDGGIAGWSPYSDFGDWSMGRIMGDTGQVVELEVIIDTGNLATDIELEIAWPAWPTGDEEFVWDTVIDKMQV